MKPFPVLLAGLLAPCLLPAFDLPAELEVTHITTVPDGNGGLEGPAWSAWEQRLYFSDQNNGILYTFTPGDTAPEVFRVYAGKVNGNTFDLSGNLYTCESVHHRVTMTNPSGEVSTLIGDIDGTLLNEPNDIVWTNFDSKEYVWFTTPSWNAGPEQDRQYVVRLDPATGEGVVMIDDVDKPNGLGFSPDGRTFYLNDNGGNTIRRYRVRNHELTFQDTLVSGINRWPDGMAVDVRGRIWMATYGSPEAGIHVYSPDGEELDFLPIPGISQGVTNCTFGGPYRSTLYITAGPSLWAIELPEPEVQLDAWLEVEAPQVHLWHSTFAGLRQQQFSSVGGLDAWEFNGQSRSATDSSQGSGSVPSTTEARFYYFIPAWDQ